MSEFNPFAGTIAAAEERGRAQVLAVVRAALPTTEADHIESRVREVTTVGRGPDGWSRVTEARERYRVALRECVRSLPAIDDDGLWIKTQVLRFIEATTVSELEEAVPAAFSGSPTVAARVQHEAAPAKAG